jgi:hypothetical protein
MSYNLHTWGTVDGTAGSLITLADRLLTGIRSCQVDQGGFTDRTTEARLNLGTAFTGFQNIADAIYFGYDVKGAAIRHALAVNGVKAGGSVLNWEYWNGAWVALTVAESVAGAKDFTAAGDVTWTAPADWVTNTVNAITAYHVRARVSGANYTTAPTLNSAVLNWVIFDGAAGTNAKVYFSPGENGAKTYYLYLEDNGAAAHTDAKSGAAILHETWDAVAHTGGAKCPTEAQVAGGGWVRKSTSLDGTARTVIAGVDRDKAILAIYSGDTAGKAVPHYLGGVASVVASDAWDGAVITSTSAVTLKNIMRWGLWNVAVAGHYIQRSYSGSGGAVQLGKAHPLGAPTVAITYPSQSDGRLYTAPFFIGDSVAAVPRGTLALEILATLHAAVLADGDTFTDPDTGYAYRVVVAQNDAAADFSTHAASFVLRNIP